MTRIRTALMLLAVVAATVTAGGRQREARWPPPFNPANSEASVLSPEDEMKTFFLPPGYRVELVASEPMVEDPILIDWDSRGRMWVIELLGYMPDLKATNERQPSGRVVRARGHERRRQDGQEGLSSSMVSCCRGP